MSLLLLTAKKKFSPYNWFKNGEQGAWYDPSDLTTLFQDSAGTTPVTLSPMEQPVGLMLDKSKGLVLGSELVVNGDGSSTVGWASAPSYPSTAASVAGKLQITATGDYGSQVQLISGLVTGKTYKVSGTRKSVTGGGKLSNIGFGSSTGATYIVVSSGAQTTETEFSYFYMYTGIYPYLILGNGQPGAGPISEFDNISVKEIAGNHAFQSDATPGKRPLLSARVNLLDKTEAISVANGYVIDANSTLNINAGIAPNGTLTASKFNSTSNTNTNQFYYRSPAGQVVGVSYTFSHYLKLGTGGTGSIRLTCGNVISTFNLLTGTVTQGVGKITPVEDNWFFCSVDGLNGNIALDNLGTFTIGQGHYVWGADLRPTNSGALLPPYQRVNTATDYDTVGFPLYLKCNGSSSAMSTNSINFTATDKMTVVTGVRKVVDQNNAILMESAVALNSSYPGAFVIHSPVGTTANYTLACIGNLPTAAVITSALNYSAPTSNVLSGLFNIGETNPNEIKLKVNSVFTGTQSGDVGSGNFGNYPFYLFARAGTLLFFNGNFYGAIIRGAQSDTGSVVQTENYMAKQTGITF